MCHLKVKNIVLGLTILITLLISCKKSANPYHESIPDDLKNWYLYLKGSYWIYQNEKTLQIDSTYIPVDPNFWQKYFYMDDGSLRGIEDHINIIYFGNLLTTCEISPENVALNTREYYADMVFNTNIGEGRTLNSNSFVFKYIQHFDSLPISNHTFYNVRQTSYSPKYNDNKTLTINFFFAKNVGLIKINEDISGVDTSFNLIRYKIFQ